MQSHKLEFMQDYNYRDAELWTDDEKEQYYTDISQDIEVDENKELFLGDE
jgi:hypothetical protein